METEIMTCLKRSVRGAITDRSTASCFITSTEARDRQRRSTQRSLFREKTQQTLIRSLNLIILHMDFHGNQLFLRLHTVMSLEKVELYYKLRINCSVG